MKITLFSQYTHFTNLQYPNFITWTREETPIHCYVNEYIQKVSSYDPRNITMLIEPRSIIPGMYDYIAKHYQNFRYIFTHDKETLKLPNAKLLYVGGVWGADPKARKTKDVSMISSDKEMCPIHIARLELARQLKGTIDTYGTFDGGVFVTTIDAHAPYRFAIAIENYIDDYYFTEKLCNCFANKTIPIYYGARKIKEIFNPQGILQVDDLEEIPPLLEILDFEKTYKAHKAAIEDNYERVKDFICIEDHWYSMYQDLLRGMYDDNI